MYTNIPVYVQLCTLCSLRDFIHISVVPACVQTENSVPPQTLSCALRFGLVSDLVSPTFFHLDTTSIGPFKPVWETLSALSFHFH